MAFATTILGITMYLIFIRNKKILLMISFLITIFMILITNKFHKMNYDYNVISSTPYHHGLLINKFGECQNIKDS